MLPIYDELFQQEEVQHILVRHEQGAGHAAEGYARSTGKAGVMLVTSGPGATNAVTPLQDALMDSVPLVCITGQVPTSADRLRCLPGMRHGRHHAALHQAQLAGQGRQHAGRRSIHEAFHVATTGRPGPVVVDIPKDVQFAKGIYTPPQTAPRTSYQPKVQGDLDKIRAAVALMSDGQAAGHLYGRRRHQFRPRRRAIFCANWSTSPAFPITSTLMGLGAYPASGKNWLGMLGMHGTYEANMAMHDCDVMLCIGARFDDRITGRLNAFSPNSKKIHIDIDPSSINKNVRVDIGILGDVGRCWRTWCACGGRPPRPTRRRSIRGGSRSRAGAPATRWPTSRTTT